MRLAIPSLCLLTLVQAIRTDAVQAQAPQVIENARPSWKPGEALHLGANPALVIGTQGGPMYEFDRVAGATRLHDGRIVEADGGSLSLRFFDSTGTRAVIGLRRGARRRSPWQTTWSHSPA